MTVTGRQPADATKTGDQTPSEEDEPPARPPPPATFYFGMNGDESDVTCASREPPKLTAVGKVKENETLAQPFRKPR